MITAPLLSSDDVLLDLQREVGIALSEAVAPVKVFDHVAEAAEPPYVVWNIGWTAERSSLNGFAQRAWFQVDVWSTYRGYKEAAAIARQCVRRLSHTLVHIEGYSPIYLIYEQAHETRDPDGKHRRFALTFHTPYVSPTGGS